MKNTKILECTYCGKAITDLGKMCFTFENENIKFYCSKKCMRGEKQNDSKSKKMG